MNSQSKLIHDKPFANTGSPRPRRSAGALLLWLVMACLLPGVLGAAVLFIYEYRTGLAQQEVTTLQTSRALTQALDNHLLKAMAVVQTLSTADSLKKRDFAAFHQLAREALSLAGLGSNVVLRDEAGHQLLNTVVEFGKPLPHAPEARDQVQGVFATGRPTISDLFIGPLLKRPVISIDVPVLADGKIVYALAIGVLPEHFNSLLKSQNLPEGWVVSLFDATVTIVARTHAPEQFVGKKAAPALVQRSSEAPEGIIQTSTLEGIPVLAAYSRSPVTKWGVVIGIPMESFKADLNRNLLLLASGFSALLALCLGLAWFLKKKIGRSFQALVAPANALGGGERFSLPSVEVKEADQVAHALERAAALLEKRNGELQESETRFRATFDQAAVGIAHVALDGTWLRVNDRLCNIVGYEREALLRLTFQAITYPDDLEADLAHLRQLLAGKIPNYITEKRYVRKDGSLAWINLTVSLIRTLAGEPDYFISVVEDISRRKAAEEERNRLANHRQMALEAARMMAWEFDPATGAVTLSENAEAVLNLQGEKHQNCDEGYALIHPEDVERHRALVTEAIATGGSYTSEYRLNHEEPVIWLEERGRAVVDGNGKTVRLVGVTHNITERKEAEATIRLLNADLERRVAERTAQLTAANQELEAFTFATSHDLRGPLGRINSFAMLLERNCRDLLEGDNQFFLSLIRQNATRLTHLVDDLLAHARVSQHTLELKLLDLSAVARAIVQDKASEARDASVDIRLNLPPVHVMADSQALDQALGNLVENAIKYSSRVPSPVVEIGGESLSDGFRLWVRDNGVGFDMKYHDKIFQIFQRLHTYTDYQGSGVGLALVKRAVERMGGKVWAKSEPGKGATFFLELQTAI